MIDIAEYEGRYATVLAEGLREVTADLRTIDPVDLVSFIRFGSHGAIEDLIQSSVELFFKHGTLISSWSACVDLAWDTYPLVTLGMEFRHPIVSVFFDLVLGAHAGEVVIQAVLFEEPEPDAAGGVDRLARAIADARLPRRAAGRVARLPTVGRGLLPR
ncbi:MAG: hypothetical protein ACRYGP_03260 [Janthinobacterium lividum]